MGALEKGFKKSQICSGRAPGNPQGLRECFSKLLKSKFGAPRGAPGRPRGPPRDLRVRTIVFPDWMSKFAKGSVPRDDGSI